MPVHSVRRLPSGDGIWKQNAQSDQERLENVPVSCHRRTVSITSRTSPGGPPDDRPPSTAIDAAGQQTASAQI